MQAASHGKALAGNGDTDGAHSTVSDEFKSLGGSGSYGFKLGHNTATISSLVVTGINGTSQTANLFTSNGQQKGINSKTGKGWVGNEGTYQSGYNSIKSSNSSLLIGFSLVVVLNCLNPLIA